MLKAPIVFDYSVNFKVILIIKYFVTRGTKIKHNKINVAVKLRGGTIAHTERGQK